ncbi:MAG: hypothetical protein AAF968_04445 [Pseudomonadota bacterium]
MSTIIHSAGFTPTDPTTLGRWTDIDIGGLPTVHDPFCTLGIDAVLLPPERLRIVGEAWTLRQVDGTEDALRQALERIPPQMVLVVECTASPLIWHRDLLARAIGKQLAGLVVSGSIERKDDADFADIPLFICSPSAQRVGGELLSEINCIVQVGQTFVRPGDFIIGQRDGVAAISRTSDRISALTPKALKAPFQRSAVVSLSRATIKSQYA